MGYHPGARPDNPMERRIELVLRQGETPQAGLAALMASRPELFRRDVEGRLVALLEGEAFWHAEYTNSWSFFVPGALVPFVDQLDPRFVEFNNSFDGAHCCEGSTHEEDAAVQFRSRILLPHGYTPRVFQEGERRVERWALEPNMPLWEAWIEYRRTAPHNPRNILSGPGYPGPTTHAWNATLFQSVPVRKQSNRGKGVETCFWDDLKLFHWEAKTADPAAPEVAAFEAYEGLDGEQPANRKDALAMTSVINPVLKEGMGMVKAKISACSAPKRR